METINFDKRDKVKNIIENKINKNDIIENKINFKIAVIAITENGKKTADKIKKVKDVDLFFQKKGIKELTGKLFEEYDCIVFISACGIAVRCISPYLKSKFEDPAILVVDDNGNNVISLLSGHIGGANEITKEIASILGANPIITTSTDTNKKGALDVIASKIGGYIKNFRESSKYINSCLVNNKKVGIYFDENYIEEKEKLNLSGFEIIEETSIEKIKDLQAIVTVTDKIESFIDRIIEDENINYVKHIKLIPRKIVLGMGCRKETELENMLNEFYNFAYINNIHPAAIVKTGSLIIKKDELCMQELSKLLCADFILFNTEEISTCDFLFDKSAFVKKNTGVYSVAQPSAYLLSNGNVISKKYKKNKTTFAFGRMKG